MNIKSILKNKNFVILLAILISLSISDPSVANTNYNFTQVSEDQDADSTVNIGQNLTSSTNSQAKDGSYEEIVEENKGTFALYDYNLDTGASNLDGIENSGNANNIANAANKDGTYLNFTEEVSTRSADMQGSYFPGSKSLKHILLVVCKN